MEKISQFGCLFGLALVSGLAMADEAAIRKAVSNFVPADKIESVKASEVPNLYEVVVENSVVYVTEDGKYLLHGQILETATKRNVTEAAQAQIEAKQVGVRKAALEGMGEQNMIVFKAKNPKHFVSVFTDVDCGYCRKLHSEIDQYLAQGITVRYLFYPRAGKGSDAYNKAVSVWCATDRQKALTAAKKGEKLESKTCDNPIDRHMALAEKFGLNGTPMIITEKGTSFPGYVPADKLAQVLESD